MYLATLCQENVIKSLAGIIPKSLYSIHRTFNNDHDGVVEYVVCSKCYYLRKQSQCITIQQKCDFVEFPRHPHASRRSKCDTILMKSVRIGTKSKLVPRKSFFYHSVIDGIEKLMARKDFLQHCDNWRENVAKIPDGIFTDIYDGHVWKDLQTIKDSPFLAIPGNLCLMLNIDWFNPYEQTIYSVGAIYLVVQNLPRYERFKLENIILVGLIPGPNEPSKNVNNYLEPLIDDLCILYRGVELSDPCTLPH